MPKAANNIGRRLGGTVKKLAGTKCKGWFSPHMVAAARAIAQRIPLVDLVLEIRDARVPYACLSSFLSALCISYTYILYTQKWTHTTCLMNVYREGGFTLCVFWAFPLALFSSMRAFFIGFRFPFINYMEVRLPRGSLVKFRGQFC